MKPPKTIKAYLKMIRHICDTPIAHLTGSEKLTDAEYKILTEASAVMINEMGEEPAIELQQKFKITGRY